MAHYQLVRPIWERCSAVLPAAFNTIFLPGQKGAQEQLRGWLESEYESLKVKLIRLAGKAEYTVQVLWDTESVARRLVEVDPALAQAQAAVRSSAAGTAYLERPRLEKALRAAVETEAALRFRSLYARLSTAAQAMVVEKAKPAPPPHQMLLHVSCLVDRQDQTTLMRCLGEIEGLGDYLVRVIGPWPPYSFC